MLEDLDHLAGRVEQLVRLAESAKAEAALLSERLAHSEAENRHLRGMLATARERVDSVLARIPDPDASRLEATEQEPHGTA